MYPHSGKTTDKLILEESEITNKPNKREHDVLVSTGEQITVAKLCMCLQEIGYNAVSYTGWQVPIITNSIYGNARIKDIATDRIKTDLNNRKIVVVAGFQGVDENLNITTLGRGGSDTTAVALAAALQAERCDIFTDVDGIFSSDPRVVKNVSKIDTISYDEMLELASLGAKVLHSRCVEIGKKYQIPIYVKSTFENESRGTIVHEENCLEELCIRGIAKEDNIVRITLVGKNNKIGRIYKVFKLLADYDINVDMIVQPFGEHIEKDISFTIKEKDLKIALELLNQKADMLNIQEIKPSPPASKISIVGVGIGNNPGVAANLFEVLYENNINMHMISTSEIKISVLVNNNVADMAMNAIHNKFIEEMNTQAIIKTT